MEIISCIKFRVFLNYYRPQPKLLLIFELGMYNFNFKLIFLKNVDVSTS